MDQVTEFKKVFDEFRPMLDSWWPYVFGLVVGIIGAIRSYMAGPMCPNDDRIDGKTVVITGATSGIGRETALELARRGGHIILAVRDVISGTKVADEINALPGGKAEVKILNLASLKSVQEFADKLEVNEIDILVNNAGIAFHPFEMTDECFELHFVTNYVGPFLLTQLLLPKLEAAEQGRIINVTAQAHSASTIHLDDLNLEREYSARDAFGQSKLALVYMTMTLSKLLKETRVTCNAVNPGLVRGTRHMRSSPIEHGFVIKLAMYPWMWLLMKNPIQGAQTTIFAAVTKALDKTTGMYLSDCEIKQPTPSESMATEVYEKSMSLVRPYMQVTQAEDRPIQMGRETIDEES